MAVSYRHPGRVDNTENLRMNFLYKAACAIQNCLDEAEPESVVICVRFAAEASSEPTPEEVIECSSHASVKEALKWRRSLEAPPGLRLVEFLYGPKSEVAQALAWPA
jgi:hypothetical protein